MTDYNFDNPYFKNNDNIENVFENKFVEEPVATPVSHTDDTLEFSPVKESDTPFFSPDTNNVDFNVPSPEVVNTPRTPSENSTAPQADEASETIGGNSTAGYAYSPQPTPQPQQQVPVSQPQQQYQSPHSYEWYGGNPRGSYYQPPQLVAQPAPRKGVSKGLFFGGIALCLCLSFVFGLAGTWVYDKFGSSAGIKNTNGVTINQVESQSGSSTSYDSGLSTVEIVNKTADSVVEITTETVKTGVFAQQYIDSGAGSGVIIDSKGFIVTNHHVIDGATKISVSLRDGTSYSATLVGSDAELDVALLEISPDKTLTAATFGDSSTLMVGQRTVAIGNPLGQLGGSVTEGIISALNRDVVIDGQTMSLLQTDTAINPGNSGGGLFDSNGNLIGIVNAKSSGSEIEGLGFAIPINDVIDIIGDLSEYGYVRGRVDLGITFIDVESEQVAWMYRLDETGCYVYSVEENRNADKAGLASGDRVISVNGTEIENSDDIEEIIKNSTVGEEVTFEVKSISDKIHKISFKLEEYVPETKNDNFFDNNGGALDDFSYWWSYYE